MTTAKDMANTMQGGKPLKQRDAYKMWVYLLQKLVDDGGLNEADYKTLWEQIVLDPK